MRRTLERARERIAAAGAAREWTMLIDGFQVLCWAGMGDAERSLDLARRGVEKTRADAVDCALIYAGALRARVLCILGEPEYQPELEAQIAETLELIQRWDMKALLPLIAARVSRTRMVARRRGRHGARSRRSAAPLRGDGRHRLGRVRAIDRGVTRSGA